jgi:hypothetical protein
MWKKVLIQKKTHFILSTIDVKKYFAFKAQGETSCIFSSSGGKQERKGFFFGLNGALGEKKTVKF